MFIPAGIFLSWFSFIFICLNNTTITLAQPPDFLYYICQSSANYTRNSTYQRNLNTALSALPSTNSGLGFFNTSHGQGGDRVNSIALCRGDVSPDACLTCLNDSIVNLLQLCPNQKEAVGYYDYCLLQYSNRAILGNNPIQTSVFLLNVQNATDQDRFIWDLRPLLSNLTADAAAGGSLRKFASGNTTGPDFTTIYGLVQCTPALSQLRCSECLENAISQFAVRFSGAVGGRTIGPMCNFRYETYGFFNVSTLVIPPPRSPSPAPPNPWASPPFSSPSKGCLSTQLEFIYCNQKTLTICKRKAK